VSKSPAYICLHGQGDRSAWKEELEPELSHASTEDVSAYYEGEHLAYVISITAHDTGDGMALQVALLVQMLFEAPMMEELAQRVEQTLQKAEGERGSFNSATFFEFLVNFAFSINIGWQIWKPPTLPEIAFKV
jgi:hypothetical protein